MNADGVQMTLYVLNRECDFGVNGHGQIYMYVKSDYIDLNFNSSKLFWWCLPELFRWQGSVLIPGVALEGQSHNP